MGYVSKERINLDSTIEVSIFETNPILKHDNISLIEYATFFGSLNIFKYLYENSKIEIDDSIFKYAIYGRKIELIKFIEEKERKKKEKERKKEEEGKEEEIVITINKELIKGLVTCHDIDIFNYFETKYQIFESQNAKMYLCKFAFKYRNYNLISYNKPNDSFLLRCIYKLNILLKTSNFKLKEELWCDYAAKYSNISIIKLVFNRKDINTTKIPNMLIKINEESIKVSRFEILRKPPQFLVDFESPEPYSIYKNKDNGKYYQWDSGRGSWTIVILEEGSGHCDIF